MCVFHTNEFLNEIVGLGKTEGMLDILSILTL